jgi:hypothetical protein
MSMTVPSQRSDPTGQGGGRDNDDEEFYSVHSQVWPIEICKGGGGGQTADNIHAAPSTKKEIGNPQIGKIDRGRDMGRIIFIASSHCSVREGSCQSAPHPRRVTIRHSSCLEGGSVTVEFGVATGHRQ